MPEHKGNVFRGRLGYILRDVTCVGDAGRVRGTVRIPGSMRVFPMLRNPCPAR